MHASPLTVRPFQRHDVTDVLRLMRGLAIFEGYIDKFCVTEADLAEHGLGETPRFGVSSRSFAAARSASPSTTSSPGPTT